MWKFLDSKYVSAFGKALVVTIASQDAQEIATIYDTSKFLNLMRLKYDVLLSGDVGYVDKQLVRFGHMGISASVDYLCPTFEAIEMSLEELGFEFKNKGTLKIFTDLI